MERVGRDALLKAQSLVWKHILNYVNSMSLKCAVELQIPDVIHAHGGSMTHSDLVAALKIPKTMAEPLGRLMRMLSHTGFFAVKDRAPPPGDVVYSLTEASTLLLTDSSTGIAPFVLANLDPVMVDPWHSLSTWFREPKRTSLSPMEMLHGEGIWSVASRKPEFSKVFDDAMATDARFVMKLVVKECMGSFKGLRSLVDVGGGTGVAASLIADAFPHVKCSVLDLPHVVANSIEVGNVEFIAGDMFQWIPPSDAVLLKWILHDWSDDHCIKILKRCKEAIPCKADGGKVIIIDMIVNSDKGNLVNFNKDNHRSTEIKYLFDLLMMTCTGGKERNEKEWQKLFAAAGFCGYKVVSTIGLRSVIEVYL